MIRLDGISYRYPGESIASLHGVTLDIPAGRVTGVVGPARAGKTTICLVAGGLAPRVVGGSLTGNVRIDGRDIARWPMYQVGDNVATGLQDPGGQLTLVADTVLEEAAFGPANQGLERDEVMTRAQDALERVGISALAERHPEHLSGGQQQLVVLAGLLAMDPRMLVLDEPVAHLDGSGAQLVFEAIGAIAAGGTGVLVVEQRTALLADHADSIAVVAAGNIVSSGTPEAVLSDPTVAGLGIAEPPAVRLRRLLSEADLDPALAGLEP